MERYHVIPVLIDQPNIIQTLVLPTEIRHITGVMFFPVIAATGTPDTEPLGTVGFSLDCERLNVVANQAIYKKQPVFQETASDYQSGGGEVFLDKGFTKNDFFECNDTVKGNSFVVFKYQNRKMIVTKSDAEQYNEDIQKLFTLRGKNVLYNGKPFRFRGAQTNLEEIIKMYDIHFRCYEIAKSELNDELYRFRNPDGSAFFVPDATADRKFIMKIIIRYE
jgi:hypothetical protein